ncbi:MULTISPECIES: class I SAM-dependent methyltransferase [Bradyrhizobium]|uniref:2-polyprenyl-3-methyl-5-hydroxy-6-metoxy-1, 4-benzoquinol methylase n=1 Tax=Bradyrhizobium yuanmingense TaxID=108015 RepID=A0ABV4GJZ2_9BRAD|nr:MULTISPECIES: class I SAM-dependent methyltransferase [Bradyrhizobium]MCA1390207.1 class I SAM-dependent methyltransferase [Bradyrhizobium sp. IC3123]MCA1437194.1 class I SAM-dependent methyltransferase [Bradyrhizobium sp. BRP20]MCA1472953.1 class I SAM-dependent methyltransferase [Bradyrhizobium sp. IC3195]MCA1477974.1 class I SAM-dependent methyltransferase [Bradyrhizobium sp. NBAIM08]MCA1498974.1 class I SAM-dependent methyltransferase [Bradyrhizobium sp. NBAIM14]
MTSLATQRFDKLSTNFATSEVHSSSHSIRRLHELLDLPAGASVVDIACGAGHLALSFAGRAKRIVGVDGAPTMLGAFQRLANEKAIQVETVLAMSDSVSLRSGEFDVAVSRLAPHHFPNLQASVREMARLVRPGGMSQLSTCMATTIPTLTNSTIGWKFCTIQRTSEATRRWPGEIPWRAPIWRS